jgi:hypothetical protein
MAQPPPPSPLYRSKKSIYICYVTNDDDAIERRDLQMICVKRSGQRRWNVGRCAYTLTLFSLLYIQQHRRVCCKNTHHPLDICLKCALWCVELLSLYIITSYTRRKKKKIDWRLLLYISRTGSGVLFFSLVAVFRSFFLSSFVLLHPSGGPYFR